MEDFTPRTIEPQQPDDAEVGSYENNNPTGEIQSNNGSLLTSYEVGSYFAANMQDYNSSDKIDYITNEMAKMGFEGTDALMFIQNIENRMSPPPIGMDRLNHFWNYFKLMLASNDINKRKRLYEQ